MALAALAAITIALVAWAYARGLYTSVWNSDAVQLLKLHEDLMEDGGQLSDWTLSAAPSFLPDWPVHWLSELLTPGPVSAMALYMALQLTLICAGAAYALRSAGVVGGRLRWTVAALVALIFALTLTPASPFHRIGWPVYHAGVLSLYLLALGGAFRVLDDKALPRGALLVMVASVGAAALSDTLSLVQLVAPLCGLFVLHVLLQRISARRAAGAVFLVAVAGLIGYSVQIMLVPPYAELSPSLDFAKPGGAAQTLLSTLGASMVAHPLTGAVIVLGWLATFWFTARGLIRPARRDGLFALAAFTVGTAITSTAFTLLLSGLPAAWRYMLPSLVLPVMVLAGAAARIGSDPARARVLLATAFISAGFGVHAVAKTGTGTDTQNIEAACLSDALDDMPGASAGLSGAALYWDAKVMDVLMPLDTTIAQVTQTGEAFAPVGSRDWQRRRYDFVIAQPGHPDPAWRLDTARLEAINGAPDMRQRCGGREVLAYEAGLSLVDTRSVWRGCELPNFGRVDADGCTVEQGEPGFVTFGPYLPTEAGRYRFTLRYRANGTGGRWDAVATDDGSAFTVLGEGALPATNGEPGDVSGTLVRRAGDAGPRVELRSYAGETTGLVIEEIVIEALDANGLDESETVPQTDRREP